MFLEKLRDCEDELVFVLSKVDTQELCVKFFEGCLLSSESYAHFTSLDHSRLKPQLQVRYLVRLASERVKTDPALGLNLIDVLDTLEGVPSSVTDILKQAMADSNEGPTDDFDTVGGLSATAMGEASEEKDIVLTQKDVTLLMELLSEISHKWEEVAISLGLQRHEIAECKAGSNAISLYNVVRFWLAYHSNTTLKKLTHVLGSAIVGEKMLSLKLRKKVLEATITKCSQEDKNAHDGANISSQTPRIVSQSLPTEVADGKSTLLQVQARPRESVVSFQWNKDDQPLANSSRYSGVDEDILVVRHASHGTEGEYTCCVSLQDRQVTSNSITLTVKFPLAENLPLNRYSKLNKVPNTKTEWPPEVSSSFNLAPVKSTSIKKNKTDLSICGDADDIFAEKKKIEVLDTRIGGSESKATAKLQKYISSIQEQYQKDLEEEQIDQEIICEVAKSMHSWDTKYDLLQLDYNEMKVIKEDNSSVILQRIAALNHWKNRVGPLGTYKNLLEILALGDWHDGANNVIRFINNGSRPRRIACSSSGEQSEGKICFTHGGQKRYSEQSETSKYPQIEDNTSDRS